MSDDAARYLSPHRRTSTSFLAIFALVAGCSDAPPASTPDAAVDTGAASDSPCPG